MSPERTTRDRVIDGTLLALALLLAASQIIERAEQARDDGPRAFGPADVRDLEQDGMIHDASATYPTAVRDLIGLEGKPGDTPAAIVDGALTRARRTPWATSIVFTAAAMATVYDRDTEAITALRELERRADPPLAADWKLPVASLRAHASGEDVELAPITSKLEEIGASRWLVARMEARHLHNAGQGAAAAAKREEAAGIAVGWVDAVMLITFIKYGILFVGLVVIVGGPFARRALVRAGHPGIGDAPSPFLVGRTQRVILAWFVGHAAIAIVITLVAQALGADASSPAWPRTATMLDALQVLAHGALAVVLIQAQARPPDDSRPLAACLDLNARRVPRGPLGVALWLVPGVALATFLVAAGFIVSVMLFGPPRGAQPTIELVLQDGGAATLAFALVSAVLLAPVVEEIIFRGFLYRNLRDTFGVRGAVLLSGLIFGAVHLDPDHLLPLAAMGVALALLYEWSGSLLVPILVHAAWNLLNLLSVWAIYQAA